VAAYDNVFLPQLCLSRKSGENKGKKSKQTSMKYNAQRLHEKGVLIEIDDLQTNQ
jgi:Ras GTPase-activating-like protein IQGAP1